MQLVDATYIDSWRLYKPDAHTTICVNENHELWNFLWFTLSACPIYVWDPNVLITVLTDVLLAHWWLQKYINDVEIASAANIQSDRRNYGKCHFTNISNSLIPSDVVWLHDFCQQNGDTKLLHQPVVN